MAKTTRLEAIQFEADGTVLVRIQKLTTDPDTGEVLKSEWHRTSIRPGGNPTNQMAVVNGHLNSMGYQSVPTKEVDLLGTIVSTVHTDEVKTAYAVKYEAALAAVE